MPSAVLPTDRLPHGWQVLSIILGTASMFVLCWYLSQQGLLDLAATGLAFFALTMVRLTGPSLSSRVPREFQRSAGIIDALREDYQQWVASRRLASQTILALLMTIAFMIGRYIASAVLYAIATPWLAVSVGLLVAAAIASPVLVRTVTNGIRDLGRSDSPTTDTTDED